jgi:pSer/pThr/pTyr-binding forkhead associated (FHA) protein
MIELIFTQGPMTGVRFAIETDSISIGRLHECDIELNQPNVSRRHAFIKRIGEQLQVIDNNSGNGTFVNGRRVKNAELRNGDEISIGTHTLRVEFFSERLTNQEIEVAKVKAAQKPTRVEKLSRFIVIDRTGDESRTAEFSSESLSIGRGEKCRLMLDDPEISRLHATIHHRDGGFTIKDSGSVNGTHLNGERIIEEALKSGDLIELGHAAIACEIIGVVLHLTVTSRAAGSGDSGSERTIQSRGARSPGAPEKPAIRVEAQASALPAANAGVALPPYPIIRVLATVLAVALLLLLMGRNYAAPVRHADLTNERLKFIEPHQNAAS